MRTLRGVATVVRRRGVGYAWYLMFARLWSRFAYRWLRGSKAPALLRPLFDTTRWTAGTRADAAALSKTGLLATSPIELPHDDLPRALNHRVGPSVLIEREAARLNARMRAWRHIRPYQIEVLTGDTRRL